MLAGITDLGHQIFVDPEQQGQFRRDLEDSGVIRDREYQVYRQNRSTFWVAVNARAVRDNTGVISYYEGFIQDITERKQGKV
jgi:PAS domain S-box-containing protein